MGIQLSTAMLKLLVVNLISSDLSYAAGSKPWVFVDEDYVADDCYSMWPEFRLSMAFDEIPEIVWILKERVKQLCDVHSRPSKKMESVLDDAVKCMNDDIVMYCTDDSASEISMLTSDNVKAVAAAGDARDVITRTRITHLFDILTLLSMIEPLGPKMILTPRHAAIHVVLQEHVAEAIWIYNNETSGEHTGVQHIVHNQRILHNIQMDRQLKVGLALTTNCEDHEEILWSVETIKATHVFTPPTCQELDLYYMIAHKMGPRIAMFGNTRGVEEIFHTGGLSAMKYMMSLIYSEERRFMEVLQEEYIKMLHTTFPFIPKELKSTAVLMWFDNNKQFVINELAAMAKFPCGLKYFEDFLLVSEEIHSLLDGILHGLDHGNDTMDRFLHDESHYRSAAEGITDVLQFHRISLH